jgi:hypothetical protein
MSAVAFGAFATVCAGIVAVATIAVTTQLVRRQLRTWRLGREYLRIAFDDMDAAERKLTTVRFVTSTAQEFKKEMAP